MRHNPSFDFLFNPQSPGGLKFKQEMDKLLRHKESGYTPIAIPPAPTPPSSFQPTPIVPSTVPVSSHISPSQHSTAPINHQSNTATTRVRKSRWGPSVTKENPSTQSVPQATAHAHPQALGQPLPQMVTMDPILQRQLQEQKEMQMLEKRIRDAAARQLMTSSSTSSQSAGQLLAQDRLAHYKELAMYDDESAPRDTIEDAENNDGVIEDGTWEHRKRAKEMLATAMKSDASALLSSSKHHISDFLPKDELDKFLKKSKGEVLIDEGPNADKKIDGSNIGFQMLERGGWAEGKGLGSTSSSTSSGVSSIVNPISATQSTSGLTGAGVGVKPEHEVAEGDDEFDSYRKRMMLSYRFRPNPLNNPRRDYY